ncbi:MAG TPA: redoxin family protein [Roseiflexaceae bacterium]|nr:redoxin family protein [Roseiflexaceae bacterium]
MHSLMLRIMLLCGILLLGACAARPAASPAPPSDRVAVTEQPMAEQPTTEQPTAEQPTTEQPTTEQPTTEQPTTEQPAWQTLSLINARSGASFTLGDFAGKTVYVEPMATWCSKCREQLIQLNMVRNQLDNDRFVFIALSVETAISSAELARYADTQGFDFIFAVMTPELLLALSDTFGRTISNPPATPHFIILPDGSTSGLSTGIKPADMLLTALQEAGGQQ